MTHNSIYEELSALERDGVPCVLVTLVETLGSAPQDAGAKMIVLADGLHGGTVGGGRVEALAIEEARKLLAAGASAPQFTQWSLKADVGMTCGGSVKLYFEPHRAAALWPIVIFGAGHLAQALLPVLIPLRCRITLFDTRSEWIDRLPAARNLSVRRVDNLADQIPTLPDGAFVLFMTKGHATDRPGLQRALGQRHFPFVGVIGSAAKAAILRREMIADGLPEARAGQFHCPLGLDFGSNDPHEIALSIAAQLLTVRDQIEAKGSAH